MKKLISIIVPFYNEQESLENTVEQILNVINKLTEKYLFEIILLDNHSYDASSQQAIKLSEKHKNIKVIRQSRNFGYQANILTGYKKCKGDAAIQIDADGQDNPELIEKLIKNWEKGFNVVYGIRKNRNENLILKLTRKVFYKILHFIADINIPVDAGDFRLIDKKIIQLLNLFNEKNIYLRGLISYLGFKQIGFEYYRENRKSGVSKFNLIGYFKLAFIAFFSFSKKPLILVFITGIVLFFLSLVLSIYYLFLFISGSISQPGFSTIILCLLFFFALNFLFLGILSLYTGLILDEVKNRPRYIIEDNEDR